MVSAIVGGNWGDEGKGKMCDILSKDADVVIRFQGGANAGHTIVNEYGKTALHMLPSGIFRQDVINVIGQGVAFDINAFFEELKSVKEKGMKNPNIVISDRVQILMPYHIKLDELEEQRLGKASFGSTKSGIAPFYSDKYAKIGIQISEIYDDEHLKNRLTNILTAKNKIISALYGEENQVDIDEMYEFLVNSRDKLKPYLCNVVKLVNEKIKENKNIIIAIGGCMMQEEHITEKIKKSYPFVDVVFGTHTLHKFPEDLYTAITKNKKVKDVIDIDGEIYEGLPVKRSSNKQASVIIMYGCNNFCSYCIVPYVRGRERSRKPEDILNEIKELAKEGYREITLLGQNVNSYKGGENYNFANLLEDIDKIEGIEVIRFVSPHPKDFTDDVIDVISKSSKISRLIHVPLQSGSTNVLKEMNRKYTKEQYLDLIKRIRNKIPDVVFSTDIIVGFPGETEEDFEDTIDVVKQVNFEQIFMFIYSRRIGTRADKMENQILEEIKHKRFDRLKQVFEESVEENNKKYIGTTQKILVEGYSKNNQDMLTGRTDTNKVVIFEGPEELIGKIINIKIISEHKWYLKGEVLNG